MTGHLSVIIRIMYTIAARVVCQDLLYVPGSEDAVIFRVEIIRGSNSHDLEAAGVSYVVLVSAMPQLLLTWWQLWRQNVVVKEYYYLNINCGICRQCWTPNSVCGLELSFLLIIELLYIG